METPKLNGSTTVPAVNGAAILMDKIRAARENELDITSDEDLGIGIMNLISMEEHLFMTANKTGKDHFASSMRLMEVGTKELKIHGVAQAKPYFEKSYRLFRMFWEVVLPQAQRQDEPRPVALPLKKKSCCTSSQTARTALSWSRSWSATISTKCST